MDRRFLHFVRRMERDHDSTWSNIHEDCRHALFMYLIRGLQPGSFLTAVLTNNLYRAAEVADFENRQRLAWVAQWVTYALPRICYGSAEAMDQWMARTDREREELLIAQGLLPTLFEVIRDPDAELT